jgi:hypothetical protein
MHLEGRTRRFALVTAATVVLFAPRWARRSAGGSMPWCTVSLLAFVFGVISLPAFLAFLGWRSSTA